MTIPKTCLPPETTAAARPCERKAIEHSGEHSWADTGSVISKTHKTPRGKTHIYNLTGLLLILIYLSQAMWGVHWPWLSDMQKNELYKQLTGLFLVLLIAYQWRLSWLRSTYDARACRHQWLRHQKVGSFAPLLFYAHSTQLGHAYLALLSGIFLAIILLGLCNPTFLKLNNRLLFNSWLILHVAGSVMLLPLVASHIYFTFYYE